MGKKIKPIRKLAPERHDDDDPYNRGGFAYAKWNGERCQHMDSSGTNRCTLRRHKDAVHVFGSPRWEVEACHSQAVVDVLSERLRQIGDEGWTAEHDDEHADNSMAIAAACYALPPGMRQMTEMSCPWGWPWSPSWWKPKDRRRDLVRAAALILAEIGRIDRRLSTPRRK